MSDEKSWMSLVLSVPAIILFLLEIALLSGSGTTQLFSKWGAAIFFIVWIIFFVMEVIDLSEGLTPWNVAGMVIMILVMAGFLMVTAPWYHGIAMWFYRNPVVWEWLALSVIIPIIIGLLYVLKTKNDFSDAFLGMFILFWIVLIAGGIIFGAMAISYPQCEIAKSIDISEIQDLPNMDANYTRILPRAVADRFAVDACQYPQYTPQRPPDIAFGNETMYWSYVLVPDGLVNTYNLKDKGVVFVDMTTSEKNLLVKEKSLTIGPGMKVTDDVYWKIYKKHYWIDAEKPNGIYYNGKVYLVIPYIKYETKWHFPIWYKVPKWGGVILVNETGNIQFLNPKEARENPVLKGQKLFPENLARYYIESQRYWMAKNSFWSGTWNVWIHHKEELEITDVSSQGNRQPFLIKTTDGLKWLISTEPYGKAHGIYRVYLIDARTGKTEYKQFLAKEVGPVRASDYVRKSNPLFDWSTFRTVEPIPVVKDGVLFWEVRIVPRDGSGIAKISFVNSEDGNVLMFENSRELKEFLEKGTISHKNLTDKNKISGIIVDVDAFEQQGNTRWIVTVKNDSQNIDFLARAEDLNFTELKIITDLKSNDRVTIIYEIEQGTNIIEKINL